MKEEPEKAAPQGDSSTPSNELSLDFYKEIGQNIRATDEISFKLLGIVPLASGVGAGVLTLLEKGKLLGEGKESLGAVIFLSLFGALITYGLFIWERRNIQKCNWLMERAADFELRLLGETPQRPTSIQWEGWGAEMKPASRSRRTQWGKTEAERLIYSAAIVAWLIPAVVALYKLWL